MKFKIMSDTRIKGKPIAAGDIIELDENTADGEETIGHLAAANRIRQATDEDIAAAADKPKPKGKAKGEATGEQ